MHYGTMALRHYGTTALRHYGTTALWYYDTMTLWHYGKRALRHQRRIKKNQRRNKEKQQNQKTSKISGATYISDVVFMWKSRRFGNWNQIWPGFKAISAASATANHALRGTNIALRSQSKNIWTLFCFCAFALKRHTSNHLPMVLFIFHFWWQERKGILEQILWIAVWRLQHWKSGINNINGKGSSGRKGDHNLFCTLKLWYISMKRIFKTYLRSANNAFVGQSWKYFCTKLYFFTLAPLHCNYILNTKVGKKKVTLLLGRLITIWKG